MKAEEIRKIGKSLAGRVESSEPEDVAVIRFYTLTAQLEIAAQLAELNEKLGKVRIVITSAL